MKICASLQLDSSIGFDTCVIHKTCCEHGILHERVMTLLQILYKMHLVTIN